LREGEGVSNGRGERQEREKKKRKNAPKPNSPASLFSLCCIFLMVCSICHSPLDRVCGRRRRCASTRAPRPTTVRRRESTSRRTPSNRFMRAATVANAVSHRCMGASTSASSFLVASLATPSSSSGAKSPPMVPAPPGGAGAGTARPLTSSNTRGRAAARTVEVVEKKAVCV
jgi:hypothetical protein